MLVKVKKLRENAVLPRRMDQGSSGFDLYSCEDIILTRSTPVLLQTGIALGIPLGFEAQVRARSGLALKKGIAVLNGPGTIDASYTGEIGVILIYFGGTEYSEPTLQIKAGERIAQMVFCQVPDITFKEVVELEETSRGAKGFGSTGL